MGIDGKDKQDVFDEHYDGFYDDSECLYLLNNEECMAEYDCEWGEITKFSKCKDIPHCYFKQLQHLKDENKLLKATIKDINIVAVVEEKEELRRWYQEEKKSNEKLQKIYQDEHCDNLKYKQALEEINEMFLNQVAWVGQLTNFEEEIYNKINEVLK